jgi:hypothetical protein
METYRVTSPEIPFDIDSAIKNATAITEDQLGDDVLLYRKVRERDIEPSNKYPLPPPGEGASTSRSCNALRNNLTNKTRSPSLFLTQI